MLTVEKKIIGHLDGIFGREIRGWVANLEVLGGPFKLTIRKGSEELGMAVCNMPRPDVAKATKAKENCGFVFRLPAPPINPSKFAAELRFYDTTTGKEVKLLTQGDKEMSVAPAEKNVNINFVVKAILKEISALKLEVSKLKGQQKTPNSEIHGAQSETDKFKMCEEFQGGDALRRLLSNKQKVILCFGIIPWKFRHQRPQHLISKLREKYSAGVVYFNPSFVRAALPKVSIREVDGDVVEVSLATGLSSYDFYSCSGAAGSSAVISRMLAQVFEAVGNREVILSKVDHPGWCPFLRKLYNDVIVYDKMDLISDFSNSSATTIHYERELEEVADLIVASSASLINTISEKEKTILVRNAVNPDTFAAAYKSRRESRLTQQPVIGYLGAISEWFDFELLASAAKKLPGFRFRIIGGCDTTIPEKLRALKNVEFVPEIPYEGVPGELEKFAVGIIPFKLTNLIKHVDPVKAYEYLAVGLPVVATDMPELLESDGAVYKCRTKEEFCRRIAEAVRGSFVAKKMEHRRAIAQDNTWASRASLLTSHIDALRSPPSVSIVVLHYGNAMLTENCLFSIFKNTERHVEVVVVDNSGGALGQSAYINSLRQKGAIIYENPGENLGFARGMNLGIQRSKGDFVVLANNDIYVTPGWLTKMVQHFAYKRRLGILGPVTNMTGNEQKMRLVYSDIAEMELFSKHISEEFSRKTFRTNNLAFFLTMIRRDVIAKVGLLGEEYEVGYFEDDDYCRRVAAAGYEIGIADDVFIHHEHSASFSLLDDEKRQQIFISNKNKYEKKWGAWVPHKYRDDALFG